MTELLHAAVTDKILGCFYRVGNAMGHGFLESVFHRAMFHELTKAGLRVRSKVRLPVWYEDKIVGDFEADLIVEECVIIEIKAAKSIEPHAIAQLMNYLRASEIEVGLLLNFGPKLEFKRLVFENSRKARSNPPPSATSAARGESAVSAESAARRVTGPVDTGR
jgi:GxxExxY protein